LVAGVAVFLVSTLRKGHNWDGDYALYIMHAENIVAGRPYGATPYIFNPLNRIHPAAYPPGLPLLLAPVYRVAGVNLQRMKLVGVASFALFLFVFARTATHRLPTPLALALVATLGFHPWVWDFKDTVFSEFPFMFFCYATLALADGISEQPLSRRWAAMGAAAVTLALACLTRSIGLVLLPTILLVSWRATRRLVNSGTLVVLTAVLLIVLVRLVFPQDAGTYVKDFVEGSGTALLQGVRNYAGAVVWDLLGERSVRAFGLRHALTFGFMALMVAGFVGRLRVRLTVFEVFFLLYWVVLLAYPYQIEVSRYSLPVWPLMLFYGYAGAYEVGARVGKGWRIALPALLVGSLWGLYLAQYYRADFGPIPFSVTDGRSVQVFNVMKARLPADAVVLARKPTIIALFTGRRAAIWPLPFDDEAVWRYARQIGATYVLQGPLDYGVNGRKPDGFDAFIDRNQARLTLVFTNPWFRLYKITADLERSPAAVPLALASAALETEHAGEEARQDRLTADGHRRCTGDDPAHCLGIVERAEACFPPLDDRAGEQCCACD
jgi:4-amino-4-deoxy-L-arabinose transferase-like glycosyltransferase